MAFLRNAEIDVLGMFLPWWLVIGVLSYLLAWGIVALLERTQLTRHIWHLPLFFLALVVLLYSAIGLVFAP